MVFTKRLREPIMRGEITCSVRIWLRPRVREGQRYPMGDGEIQIDSITPIGLPDITPQLARASGFLGVLDLLKVAKHGKGDNIYLVRFHYLPGKGARPAQPEPPPSVVTTRRSTLPRGKIDASAKAPVPADARRGFSG